MTGLLSLSSKFCCFTGKFDRCFFSLNMINSKCDIIDMLFIICG